MESPADGWWHLDFEVPPELEESLLWRLETLGIHRVSIGFRPERPDRRTLEAWLPAVDWPLGEHGRLEAALQALGAPFDLTLPPLRWQTQAEEDWSLSWKRHWQPDPVAEGLLILPAWLEVPAEHAQRQVIRIDPGSAFGTGSHPTTRLCLEALDQRRPHGLAVADLGCGSGILAIAALLLGARRAWACDIDPPAVRATEANAALNGCTDRLQVTAGSVEALRALLGGAKAELLLANILAPVLCDLAPAFGELLADDGVGLLSGVLEDQAGPLLEVLAPLGWTGRVKMVLAPWVVLEIRRSPAASATGRD